MATRKKPALETGAPDASGPGSHLIGQAILSLMGRVPTSKEHKSKAPADDARKKTNAAAAKAALAAGAMALPPGPLGWLTIRPEMVGVW